MGKKTPIEWADSSKNIQMGCSGCELWNQATGERRCYAGILTEKWAPRKGWPDSFGEPKLFPERLQEALRWSDLTGTDREDKPWLNGLPRMIFLNDMGETFDPKLPDDWLADHLQDIADSEHIWFILTKQARRMRLFSQRHELPQNVWPGVSVTSRATLSRVDELLQVNGGGVKFISAEPLWEMVSFGQALAGGVGWIIVGGESKQERDGNEPKPLHLSWARSVLEECQRAGAACFVKQLGFAPVDDESHPPRVLELQDRSHGGDSAEWPTWINLRQMPTPPARTVRKRGRVRHVLPVVNGC